MNHHPRSSQTILMFAFGVLGPFAAVGCESAVDGASGQRSSAGVAIEAKALALAGAGSHAFRQYTPELGWSRAADTEQSNAASTTPTTYASAPVVGAAHGSLLLPLGNTALATPSSAREIQHYYLDRLLGEADATVRQEFETRMQAAEGDPRELADNAVLLAQLIDRVQPADASDLRSINRFVAKAMVGDDLPAELGLVADDATSRELYKQRCSKATVPIPPDWNPDESDPDNQWKKMPDAPKPIFIGEELLSATVWFYQSTEAGHLGTCIALPRANKNNHVITSLGVICQGKEGETACFWDNTRDLQPTAKVSIFSDSFNAGPKLDGGIGGQCTDCHRGANAFINHPASSLAVGMDLLTNWTRPLVSDNWFQNPRPDPDANEGVLDTLVRPDGSNEETCLSCHGNRPPGGLLPFFGPEHSKYCDFVIMKAILPGPMRTMPFNNTPPVVYRTDEEAIASACGWPASDFGFGPRTTVTDPAPPTDPVP